MILGFQERFIPFVEDGSKRHTIRKGKRWSVGMRADLYRKVRQKGMKLIFRATVTKVEPIRIEWNWGIPIVSVNGCALSIGEADLLAWTDGFRPSKGTPYQAFITFWRVQNKLGKKLKVFEGQIVHWDYHSRMYSVLKPVSIRGRGRKKKVRKVTTK